MRRRLIRGLLGAISLIGSFAAGLYVAWVVAPVQPVGVSPAGLRLAEKEVYIRLIADTYAIEKDLPAARTRLAQLEAGNVRQWVADLAQETAAAGDQAAAQRLARLAYALDATGSAVRELAALSTPTPLVTATPAPSPTLSPMPPESERGQFDWIVAERRRLTCDEAPGNGLLLVVHVEDAEGRPVAGVPLRVEWGNESERFFTGLQSDDPGYADFEMDSGRYVLTVDQGKSEAALDLTTDELTAQCTGTAENGPVYRGWFVRFRRVS